MYKILVNDPIEEVVIREENYDFLGDRKTFVCNTQSVHKYLKLFNDYNLTAIRIVQTFEDTYFKLNQIKKIEVIECFTINGGYKSGHGLGSKFDESQFHLLKNLKYFSLDYIRLKTPIKDFFPKLVSLRLDHSANRVYHLDNTWPKLEALYFDKYKGNLKKIGDLPFLHTLFLQYGNYQDLDTLSSFKKLNELTIYDNKKPLDISLLNNCDNLKKLDVSGCPNIYNWNALKIPSLRVLTIDKLDDSKVFVNNPGLTAFEVEKLKNDSDEATKRGLKRVWERNFRYDKNEHLNKR